MLLKFLSSTRVFNIEDGGGSAVPAQTETQPVDAGNPQENVSVDTSTSENNETPSKPTWEEDLDKIWDDAAKPETQAERDERGRFKTKNPSDDTPAEGVDGDDQPAENGDKDGPIEATDPDMPHSWSKDKADVWNALPPDAKATVLERETAMTQALSRAGRAVNQLRNVQPLLDAVEPFGEYLGQVGQSLGQSPAALVHQVLKFENTLRTAPDNDTKLSVIADICAEYGVDLTPVFGAEGHQAVTQRAPANDPRVEQLARQVHELTAAQRQQQEERHAALDAELGTEITAVEKNTQEFPHYATVKRYMAAIIPQIEDVGQPTKELLREAYRIACHAHPDVSQRIQADQRRRAEQEARDRIAGRTQKAKTAASANVRSGVPSIPKRSIGDDLNAIGDKHYR